MSNSEMEQDTQRTLGILIAKVDAVHEDVRELRSDMIPNGHSRMKENEMKLDRIMKGLYVSFGCLVILLGDKVWPFVKVMGF